MRQAIIRWTIYLLALFVIGPLAGAMTGSLRASDGSHAATPLFSTTPILGLVYGIAALLIALLVGVAAARLVSTASGFTAAGLVVAWAAWTTGDVDQMIRVSHSGSPLLSQSLEGAIFGVLALGIAAVLWIIGRPEQTDPNKRKDPEDALIAALSQGPAKLFYKVFKGKGGAAVIPVALLAGAAAAWFIGVSPIKGQAVFAAITAGIVAAAAGRLVELEVSLPTLIVPIVALAILGPLAGYAMAGGADKVVASAYANSLFPVANITALDWIAGALLGVPIGVGWAGSMMERHSS